MKQDLAGRKVALVGGAGFIGHNLALELKARGAHVEVVDGLQVNHLTAHATSGASRARRRRNMEILQERLELLEDAGVPLHVLDARDYHALTRVIAHEIEPDVLVHLAAVSHAGRSNKDPFSTFDHSLRTLENALDVARDTVEHFVFFSSSMVYGDFQGGAVDEDARLDPIGIYGALKLAGERLVLAYHQVFDLSYTIVRPSALYGPRCVSRRVSQIFLESAADGLGLQVSGDGSDRLDFTYIQDLVEGVCLVLREPKARNQTFNLTFGESRTIAELVEVVQAHFPDVRIETVPPPDLMPKRGTLRVDKARELLGYAPRFPLEQGFEEYVAWYRGLQGRA